MENDYNKNGGPRTIEGKMNSSKNAFKHGMCSSQILIPGEDAEAFESLVDHFEIDHNPTTATEVALVHDMAKFRWLMNRAMRLHARALENPDAIDTRFLELMMRYQNTNHRAFLNSLKALQTAQKQRLALEREFVSQQDVDVIFSPPYDDEPTSAKTAKPDPQPEETLEEEPRTFLRPPGKLA
jgi:hypothetical protein